MNPILNEVCVLVTAAVTLSLVPGLHWHRRLLRFGCERGTALWIFAVLGLIDEIAVSQPGFVNERIVLVCAAGLLSGPWVGTVVGLFVGWLAVAIHSLQLPATMIYLSCGGLSAGLLNQWRPRVAAHPLTGFCLASGISFLRSWFVTLFAADESIVRGVIEEMGTAGVLGSGTALILAVIGRLHEHERQSQELALAETRAQQTRMNPHFLFNALNTVAALAMLAPSKVPQATGRLREFLRGSFDQAERTLVPLQEELALVRAYLEIESLRYGKKLTVEQTIDPELLEALVPPFSFQPLVENAIQHGIRSSSGSGLLRLAIRAIEPWLEMSVSDNGQGVHTMEVEGVFFADRQPVHALGLLRRRLRGSFGCSFQLEAHSAVGEGTTVVMRIPLQTGDKAITRQRKRWLETVLKSLIRESSHKLLAGTR